MYLEEYFADEIKALYCSECKMVMVSKARKHLEQHFKIYHSIPDLNERPDVHDPKLYCRSCKTTSSNKSMFREHMKKIHMLNPDLEYKRLDPSLLPDVNDGNSYCQVCKHRYRSERLYKKHLFIVHGMDIPVRPDFFCAECNKYMSTSRTFKEHFKNVHTKDSGDDKSESEEEGNKKRKMEEQPIVRKKHLLSVMFQPPLIPEEYPDETHCSVCKTDHRSRGNYNQHLRTVHKDVFTVVPATRDNFPDPDHEHFYCSICNKRAISKKAFHHHLKTYHRMDFVR